MSIDGEDDEKDEKDHENTGSYNQTQYEEFYLETSHRIEDMLKGYVVHVFLPYLVCGIQLKRKSPNCCIWSSIINTIIRSANVYTQSQKKLTKCWSPVGQNFATG